MKVTTRLAAAAGVLALGSAAFATDCKPGHTPAKAEGASDLHAAAAPLVEEGQEAQVTQARNYGLRDWFGMEPREADPFDGFARPVTNLNFHHPFIWNEVRPIMLYHWFPETGILDGGRARVYAVQLHLKLTEELQFTAYKDGYSDFEPGVFQNSGGPVDIAFGLKYNVWKNLEEGNLAAFTLGLGYEFDGPGDKDVLEGEGDGFFDLFGSYARQFGDMNFIGTGGVFIPRDSDEDVRTFHWHLHADFPLTDKFAPLVEVNGYHYLDDAKRNAGLGEAVPLPIEAADYTTLGSGDVDGNDTITAAFGFRYRISDDISLGAAWEVPVTSRKDITKKRLTLDLVLRF